MANKKTILVGILVVALVIFGLLWTAIKLFFTEPPVRNWVVLITIDTLRSDHLGCYGYGKNTSPNIDRLAFSGLRFTNCYTAIPTTDPSHVSILTSTYPRTHGVIKNGWKISNSDILCLAEIFKKKGYSTAAITARATLSPTSLGLKGFDHVDAPSLKGSPFIRRTRRSGGEISKRAIELFSRHQNDDLFVWIHFFDPHRPYNPPPPFDSMFNDGVHIPGKQPGTYTDAAKTLTNDEIAYYTSLYDGAIRNMDFHIGRLLESLEEATSNYSIQPFIVLTADHGETLGELRETKSYIFDHGEYLYERDIKIPLIMSYNGKLPEGLVRDALVESIDIAPTIVDILFDKEFAEFSGTSIKKYIFDESSADKSYVFVHRRPFSTPFYWEFEADLEEHGFGIISERYKLIDNPVSGPELYDLAQDPYEDSNIAAEREKVINDLREELRKWKKEYPLSVSDSAVPKEKQEILKSLGYLP
jgi:arylsulfatase A-like enzyme